MQGWVGSSSHPLALRFRHRPQAAFGGTRTLNSGRSTGPPEPGSHGHGDDAAGDDTAGPLDGDVGRRRSCRRRSSAVVFGLPP